MVGHGAEFVRRNARRKASQRGLDIGPFSQAASSCGGQKHSANFGDLPKKYNHLDSRPAGGTLTVQFEKTGRAATVDPNRLIREFEPLLQRAAEGTEIMTELSPTVHSVDIDVIQFETALLNLIGHAGTILSNEAGFDSGLDILEKPYPHAELASQLRRAIETHLQFGCSYPCSDV